MKGSLRAPLFYFGFEWDAWYAKPLVSRTGTGQVFPLRFPRPDIPIPRRGPYRNPLILARELQLEMIRHNLTRVQLGRRHGVTSDRITQWLCLLKLPEEKQREIEALGDHWERKLVTERGLRMLQ
jgi:hypothetical protein